MTEAESEDTELAKLEFFSSLGLRKKQTTLDNFAKTVKKRQPFDDRLPPKNGLEYTGGSPSDIKEIPDNIIRELDEVMNNCNESERTSENKEEDETESVLLDSVVVPLIEELVTGPSQAEDTRSQFTNVNDEDVVIPDDFTQEYSQMYCESQYSLSSSEDVEETRPFCARCCTPLNENSMHSERDNFCDLCVRALTIPETRHKAVAGVRKRADEMLSQSDSEN